MPQYIIVYPGALFAHPTIEDARKARYDIIEGRKSIGAESIALPIIYKLEEVG